MRRLPPSAMQLELIEQTQEVDAWDRAIEVEAAERESMESILGAWKSISMPANKYSQGSAL